MSKSFTDADLRDPDMFYRVVGDNRVSAHPSSGNIHATLRSGVLSSSYVYYRRSDARAYAAALLAACDWLDEVAPLNAEGGE